MIYKYDALRRRIERTPSTGVSTKFTYDGQDVLLDQNSDATEIKYLNGLGIDNKLRQKSGGQVQYFLADHLGSTNALVNSTGTITAQTAYDAFGNASNTAFPTRYQYTGREYDSFTNLHHYRARQYSAELGRFISEDPIGFAGGDINLYGYVWNNPLMFVDSDGLQGEEIRFRMYQRTQLGNDAAQFECMAYGNCPREYGYLRCGPDPWNPFEWFVRDRIGGSTFMYGYFGSMFNYNPACKQHDRCYATCGKLQPDCDREFRENLEKECNSPGSEKDPYRDQCRRWANTYYDWVDSKLGEKAFESTQKDYGCDKGCP